jgi:hypothetical protein
LKHKQQLKFGTVMGFSSDSNSNTLKHEQVTNNAINMQLCILYTINIQFCISYVIIKMRESLRRAEAMKSVEETRV